MTSPNLTLLEIEFVSRDGDTMTGYLVLVGDPVLDNHAANKRYVDTVVSILRGASVLRDGTQQLTGNWNAGNYRITAREIEADNGILDFLIPKTGATIRVLGNIQVNGSVISGPWANFAVGDATPSVLNGKNFREVNPNPTTITAFTNITDRQEITMRFTTANTTIRHGANLQLQGAADFLGGAGDILDFIVDGAVVYERGRSVK